MSKEVVETIRKKETIGPMSKTDLFQGFKGLGGHVLVELQLGHSHHLDSPQRMEAGIIKTGKEGQEENYTHLSILTFTISTSVESH